MPTPLGHALGGLIAARLAEPARPASSSPRRPSWLALAALAVSPDLDLLFGTHSTYTHSVGAVALVFVAAAFWARRRATGALPALAVLAVAVVAAAAYGSHLLLDWLGTDSTPPYGIMLWWPFSSAFSKGPVSWFPSVARDVFSRQFWIGNTLAVAFEVAVFGPLLWLTCFIRPARR
jgi:membrane-bound metal-dependent hydrolase YbcI (DUF457 family)